MKLGTIIRAIVRPYLVVWRDAHSIVVCSGRQWNNRFMTGWAGPGAGVFERPKDVPARAETRAIGGLTLAWWGPDTLVHQDPATSSEKGAAS